MLFLLLSILLAWPRQRRESQILAESSPKTNQYWWWWRVWNSSYCSAPKVSAFLLMLFIDYFYLLFLSSFNDIDSLLLFKSSSNWSTGSSVFWTIFSLQLNFNDRFINNNNKTHRNYSKLEFSFSFFVSNSFSVVECFELNLILFWDRINKWPFFFHKITIHRFHLLDKLFVTLVDFFLFIKWPNKKCLRISRGSTPIKIG